MSNFPRLILENLPSGFGIDLIRNANSKFFHLPYLSRKYAFSGFEKQLHKYNGTDFHQIWYNGAAYHRTDLRKIWHLSLLKCESRNLSFLFIPLTRTPMFRTATMYSHVRHFDPLVYLFILFEGNCSMLVHKIPPKSTHSELTLKKNLINY